MGQTLECFCEGEYDQAPELLPEGAAAEPPVHDALQRAAEKQLENPVQGDQDFASFANSLSPSMTNSSAAQQQEVLANAAAELQRMRLAAAEEQSLAATARLRSERQAAEKRKAAGSARWFRGAPQQSTASAANKSEIGAVSREEYHAAGGSQSQFELFDTNHDGVLDATELRNSDDLIARVLSRQKEVELKQTRALEEARIRNAVADEAARIRAADLQAEREGPDGVWCNECNSKIRARGKRYTKALEGGSYDVCHQCFIHLVAVEQDELILVKPSPSLSPRTSSPRTTGFFSNSSTSLEPNPQHSPNTLSNHQYL